MKKISFLLLLATMTFLASCSKDDDNNTQVVNFEGKLAGTDSVFTSTSQNLQGYYYYDTFTDNDNILKFDSYYSIYGNTRYYAGLFYTNLTNNKYTSSFAPISGAAKVGKTYIAAFSSSYTPASITVNNPAQYGISSCWICNSTYAYNTMIKSINGTTPFKSGSWYKVKAIGYTSAGAKMDSTEIYLAKYTSDTDLPSKEWLYFDLSKLTNAVKVTFSASSSDIGQYGMNTAANFCLDGITVTKK